MFVSQFRGVLCQTCSAPQTQFEVHLDPIFLLLVGLEIYQWKYPLNWESMGPVIERLLVHSVRIKVNRMYFIIQNKLQNLAADGMIRPRCNTMELRLPSDQKKISLWTIGQRQKQENMGFGPFVNLHLVVREKNGPYVKSLVRHWIGSQ